MAQMGNVLMLSLMDGASYDRLHHDLLSSRLPTRFRRSTQAQKLVSSWASQKFIMHGAAACRAMWWQHPRRLHTGCRMCSATRTALSRSALWRHATTTRPRLSPSSASAAAATAAWAPTLPSSRCVHIRVACHLCQPTRLLIVKCIAFRQYVVCFYEGRLVE